MVVSPHVPYGDIDVTDLKNSNYIPVVPTLWQRNNKYIVPKILMPQPLKNMASRAGSSIGVCLLTWPE